MISFEQIRIFLSVARLEHMTRAGEELGLSQSAVSAAIQALEARHAVRLFNRVGRGIELTEAGRAFLPEAGAIFARLQQAERVLTDLSQSAKGLLRVHASQTVASYWLPAHLIGLRRAHPAIDLELHIGNSAQVADAVQAGAADLGVVEGQVTRDSLHQRVVARDELVLICAAAHPAFQNRPSASAADFAALGWVLRETGSGTRSEFASYVQREGLTTAALSIVLELPSNEAVVAAVAASDCVSVLSRRAAEGAVARGDIKALPLPRAERPFSVLTHPERYKSRALLALFARFEAASAL